ncbi:hypothetical protein PCANC_07716 [Puccinia coronata f. sp. avenae]|uniref:Uncharacterized protein n=1 Tax=Puccinia coronata f. sp. avenae TaxID=200324 RepID=A0A2N5V210_9BASI|nr:hypothetical protein PCASD_04880 [Puccinia coronata f. sp. avenae]PLW52528.1 hypothetical protein PCANC_07716 [Puccinia coronata f. sp. avenae]
MTLIGLTEPAQEWPHCSPPTVGLQFLVICIKAPENLSHGGCWPGRETINRKELESFPKNQIWVEPPKPDFQSLVKIPIEDLILTTRKPGLTVHHCTQVNCL